MMEIPAAKTRNVRAVRETCPACKRRTRWPEHPLCPSCNKRFINEQAERLAEGGEIRDRLEYAIEQAEISLQELQQELELLEAGLQEVQQPLWQEAYESVRQSLREQGIFVDKAALKTFVGKKFGVLWEQKASDEQKKLARRAFGLKKAIESLKRFLASAHETIRKREQARTAAVEVSSAAGADE